MVKRFGFIELSAFTLSGLGLLLWVYLVITVPSDRPTNLVLVERGVIIAIIFLAAGLGLSVIAILRSKFRTTTAMASSNRICLVVAAVSAGAILCLIGLSGGKGLGISSTNYCINNLRSIDRATEQIALERHLKSGETVLHSDIIPRLGGKEPKCPDGGIYSYGVVGEIPKCSITAHKLD